MLVFERVTVRKDRVVADIRVDEPSPRHSTPELIDALLQKYPQLGSHTCKNPHGTTFGCVMRCTPLPHVVEHLVIQLQAEAGDGTFVGTTEWLPMRPNVARVEVSYSDDLVCLAAFSKAVALVNELTAV